jgi:hypothetical protein
MGQCTGTSKRSGERCLKDEVPGRGVCHIHGCKSPVGAASGTFKDGRHSVRGLFVAPRPPTGPVGTPDAAS